MMHVTSLIEGRLGTASRFRFGWLAGLVMLAVVPPVGFSVPAGSRGSTQAPLSLIRNALFPAADAANVCPDTPLRILFAFPPTLGAAGKIQIFDAADSRLVEAIDVGVRTAVKTIGGLDNFRYYPVILSGNQASIFLANGALDYRKTYYVTVDAGVFLDGQNPYAGIDQPNAWRFTTQAAAPPAGAASLTVAADGTGDFCTVQGALDFIPEGNTAPRTIFLRKGTYTELIFFTNKHAITLIGEDRRQSVIAYANNATFNSGGGTPSPAAPPIPAGNRSAAATSTGAASCWPTGSTTWSSPISPCGTPRPKADRRPKRSS